jgi:hypothetical protein
MVKTITIPKTAPADMKDPATGQTMEEISAYIRQAKVGDYVAIRSTYAAHLVYRIPLITGVNPKSGRVYTEDVGGLGGRSWFMKSGRNCFASKGKAVLILPTQAVRDFAANHPEGVMWLPSYSVPRA